jgi:adenylate cyclase
MGKGGFHWGARLRLASGLVLLAYIGTHILNHSLGLVSVAAMEGGREVFIAVWRSPLGTLLLYGGLTTHLALVLWSLYRRRTLRGMPAAEVAQLLAGLAIPPLLVAHVLATRGLHEFYGVNDTYAWELINLWVVSKQAGLEESILLLVVWLHGCLGLHFWLRLRPWYRRAVPWLYAVALLMPVFGLAGFLSGAREIERLAEDPAWREAFFRDLNLPMPYEVGAAMIYEWRDDFRLGFAALLALVLGARLVRDCLRHRRGGIVLAYADGRSVTIQPSTLSVLEASRLAGIPHASVCGGRGRCSTCRVRVGEGAELLPEPSAEERRVLARVGAPPGVRLACQIRPLADLQVTPLLPPGAHPRDAFARPGYLQGAEREIAILFADLRAFTPFAAHKLPYDVVFVLNQYFRLMGEAVERNGGRLDKFIGDGVMALFGIDRGAPLGCRNALAAARAMGQAMAELNRTLAHELGEPLKLGIGIHCGPAIVGEMGHARTTSLTAVGDAVNTAARLEQATKDFGAGLVVSRLVAERSGVDLASFRSEEIAIRGRPEPLAVYVLETPLALPADLKGVPRPQAAA